VLGSAVLVANHWCSICIQALNQLLEASDGFLAFPYLFGQNITAPARQAREVGCPLTFGGCRTCRCNRRASKASLIASRHGGPR
jgi:hypothetical protein